MKRVDYVIIQAGGRGSRLGKYTFNRPKALLSVNGMPLILKAFETFKDAHFIVIADYKYDVLRKYLLTFARNFKYTIIEARMTGTCSGIKEALEYIPGNTPFIITWCDLYFGNDFKLESPLDRNYIGISDSFLCRWSFQNGEFIEKPSKEYGVAGFFIFKSKSEILDVLPTDGEFVRYLSNKGIRFTPVVLRGVKEYGTTEEYEKLFSEGASRPFNRVIIKENYVEKVPTDEKGYELADKERNWYSFVNKKSFHNIPEVLSYNPLRLKRISGKHPFELKPDPKFVENIVNDLIRLHNLGSVRADRLSLDKEYFIKTYERLYQVKNLIPHAEKEEIKVNGVTCPNPFYLMDEIEKALKEIYPEEFTIIHGDPTFSNTMVDDNGNIYFIDPRGYFGYTLIYGDPGYDFAKLYYSLVGNYDKFNRKRFTLKIFENEVDLDIESAGYEKFEDLLFEMIGSSNRDKIKLLNAIIWLSLTTYAWDDYDMICGAFYNGTLKLKEVIS